MKNSFFSFFSAKNLSKNWHFIGLLQIVAGITGYIFGFLNNVQLWDYLWVCPVVAIITGFFVFFKNRFGMSSAIVWIICAPLLAVLNDVTKTFQVWHIHHLLSVIILLIILYNFKKTWNPKGFLFGLTSYYSYIMITSYISSGKINLFYEWFGYGKKILYTGIFFAFSSIVIFFWDKLDKKN